METLSDKNLDILIPEDDPTSMLSLQGPLRKTSLLPGRIEHSEKLSTALSLLRQNPSDLVLPDLNLPDSSGSNTLKVLSENYPYLPVVVITGQSDESIGPKTLRSGTQDYLKYAFQAGVNKTLSKPFESQKLIDTIN